MTPRPPRTLPSRRRVFVFDCEALSKASRGDETVALFVKAAAHHGIHVVTSALTVLEAWDPRDGRQGKAWEWTLSRIEVVHTDDRILTAARELLTRAGLHGHKYAIDAVLAAVAIRFAQPRTDVAVLTSDTDDLRKLLDGHRIRVDPI
ncbi:PIN domain-containing protein [Streptomyces sp. RerS4]|uniref:PIN domain-containing protein n=1 Tax=Streptomyces sp. RerS4 TaxID=2942449 RepID=UPI00201BCFD9|nr:PIN domain-containing protein [Streptomyces sp. RerS4]UQX02318.1 PIN domain-containing protein [Streptomyces sp. RerS4]